MSVETANIADALDRVKKLLQPFSTLLKVKPGTPDALDAIDEALKRMPPAETVGQAWQEARLALESAVDQERRQRVANFRKIEAEFVTSARSRQEYCREQNDGWRIGPLEFQLKRELAKARALYNHEVVVDWTPIAAPDDLEKLSKRAEAHLASAAFPDEMLLAVFGDAYEFERVCRQKLGKLQPDLVPVLDFYREVRAQIVRFELREKSPDRTLKLVDLPKWKFLYNLDRYRAMAAEIPEARRLALQTGSQREVERGMGVTVNGLESRLDYKTICYVVVPFGARS